MSITMGQLATRYADAAQKVGPVTDKSLRTLAQIGVGYVKQEIQAVHAVDTGTMLNSTTAEKSGKAYLIGPTVHYAVFVALGTSRMAARPFHVRAARRLSADLDDIISAGELGL